MLRDLYVDYKAVLLEDSNEAIKQANWFLNCGNDTEEINKSEKPVIFWEHDENLLFSAINDAAHKEVRETEYMHFWTFMGYFNSIREGLFSTVINIREKRNKGKALEKHEKEFLQRHKGLIDYKLISTEQREEMERINKILNGGG